MLPALQPAPPYGRTAGLTAAADLASLADPATRPDPYPVLAGLRGASPFAAAGGALMVAGRHRDCSAVLRDPRASSARGAL
jgi:cytochrome P450